ncbi:MAG: hypothetical protein R3D71_09370 [Rickettsiales bacterium]
MTNFFNLISTLLIKHAKPKTHGRYDEVVITGIEPDYYMRDLCINSTALAFDAFDPETGSLTATGLSKYGAVGNVSGAKPFMNSCMPVIRTPKFVPSTASGQNQKFAYYKNAFNTGFTTLGSDAAAGKTVYGTSNRYLTTTFPISDPASGVAVCPLSTIVQNPPTTAQEIKAAMDKCYDYYILNRATHPEWVMERTGPTTDDPLSADAPKGSPDLAIFNSCQPLMSGTNSKLFMNGQSPIGLGFAPVLQYDRADLDEADYRPSVILTQSFQKNFPNGTLPIYQDIFPCVVSPQPGDPGYVGTKKQTDWTSFNATLMLNYGMSAAVELFVLKKKWGFQYFVPMSDMSPYVSPGMAKAGFCPNVEKINIPDNPFSPRDNYKTIGGVAVGKTPGLDDWALHIGKIIMGSYTDMLSWSSSSTKDYSTDRDYSYRTSVFTPRHRIFGDWAFGYSDFLDLTKLSGLSGLTSLSSFSSSNLGSVIKFSNPLQPFDTINSLFQSANNIKNAISSVGSLGGLKDLVKDFHHPEVMCAIVPVDILESRRDAFDDCIMQRIEYNFLTWRRRNFLRYYYKRTLKSWKKPCVTRFYENDDIHDCPVSMSIQQCCRIIVKDVVPMNYMKIRTCEGLRQKRKMVFGYTHIYDAASSDKVRLLSDVANAKQAFTEAADMLERLIAEHKYSVHSEGAEAWEDAEKVINGTQSSCTNKWCPNLLTEYYKFEGALNTSITNLNSALTNAAGWLSNTVEQTVDNITNTVTNTINMTSAGVFNNILGGSGALNNVEKDWLQVAGIDVGSWLGLTSNSPSVNPVPAKDGLFINVYNRDSYDAAAEWNQKLTMIGCNDTEADGLRFNHYFKSSRLDLPELPTKFMTDATDLLQEKSDFILEEARDLANQTILEPAASLAWSKFNNIRNTANALIKQAESFPESQLKTCQVGQNNLNNTEQRIAYLSKDINLITTTLIAIGDINISNELSTLAQDYISSITSALANCTVANVEYKALQVIKDTQIDIIRKAQDVLRSTVMAAANAVESHVILKAKPIADDIIIEGTKLVSDSMGAALKQAIEQTVSAAGSYAYQGGSNMPYMRRWDTGTSAGNPVHGGSFINTLGSYDVVVGVGHEERNLYDAMPGLEKAGGGIVNNFISSISGSGSVGNIVANLSNQSGSSTNGGSILSSLGSGLVTSSPDISSIISGSSNSLASSLLSGVGNLSGTINGVLDPDGTSGITNTSFSSLLNTTVDQATTIVKDKLNTAVSNVTTNIINKVQTEATNIINSATTQVTSAISSITNPLKTGINSITSSTNQLTNIAQQLISGNASITDLSNALNTATTSANTMVSNSLTVFNSASSSLTSAQNVYQQAEQLVNDIQSGNVVGDINAAIADASAKLANLTSAQSVYNTAQSALNEATKIKDSLLQEGQQLVNDASQYIGNIPAVQQLVNDAKTALNKSLSAFDLAKNSLNTLLGGAIPNITNLSDLDLIDSSLLSNQNVSNAVDSFKTAASDLIAKQDALNIANNALTTVTNFPSTAVSGLQNKIGDLTNNLQNKINIAGTSDGISGIISGGLDTVFGSSGKTNNAPTLSSSQSLTQRARIGRIGGWEELKGHQMWTTRRHNLVCIGRYEKLFKYGGPENFVLSRAGGNYTTKDGKQWPWPLGWRGYIFDSNHNGFERKISAFGLDKAKKGDIIIYRLGGIKRISYVAEANTIAAGNPATNNAADTTHFVQIESWDEGKFPTITGSSLSWGNGVKRTIYKNSVPDDRKKITNAGTTHDISTLGTTQIAQINGQPSCEDPEFTHCVLGGTDNSSWGTVFIYRPTDPENLRLCPFIDSNSDNIQSAEFDSDSFAFCLNAGYDPPLSYRQDYIGAGAGSISDATLCGPEWTGCKTVADPADVKCFPSGDVCTKQVSQGSLPGPKTVPGTTCTVAQYNAAKTAYEADVNAKLAGVQQGYLQHDVTSRDADTKLKHQIDVQVPGRISQGSTTSSWLQGFIMPVPDPIAPTYTCTLQCVDTDGNLTGSCCNSVQTNTAEVNQRNQEIADAKAYNAPIEGAITEINSDIADTNKYYSDWQTASANLQSFVDANQARIDQLDDILEDADADNPTPAELAAYNELGPLAITIKNLNEIVVTAFDNLQNSINALQSSTLAGVAVGVGLGGTDPTDPAIEKQINDAIAAAIAAQTAADNEGKLAHDNAESIVNGIPPFKCPWP